MSHRAIVAACRKRAAFATTLRSITIADPVADNKPSFNPHPTPWRTTPRRLHNTTPTLLTRGACVWQRVYYMAFHELCRQVMVQSVPRGELMHRLWMDHTHASLSQPSSNPHPTLGSGWTTLMQPAATPKH